MNPPLRLVIRAAMPVSILQDRHRFRFKSGRLKLGFLNTLIHALDLDSLPRLGLLDTNMSNV